MTSPVKVRAAPMRVFMLAPPTDPDGRVPTASLH
jgi:hypothetical protein